MELIEWDRVQIDFGEGFIDQIIQLSVLPKLVVLLYHKPLGCVVSKSDPYNQTIFDLLPGEFSTFDYVGRLDKNTSWLLLLTNDKKLVHELSHPSKGLIKKYIVRIDSILSEKELVESKQGLWVNEDWRVVTIKKDLKGSKEFTSDFLKFESVKQVQEKGFVELEITLVEWHKRHIRRLLKGLGKKIFSLHRTDFGPYKLGGLKLGEWMRIEKL